MVCYLIYFDEDMNLYDGAETGYQKTAASDPDRDGYCSSLHSAVF